MESKVTIEDLRFMHERAWNRIMWYRTEMWKISIALYTALAGFVAASLQFADSVKDKDTFSIVATIVGLALIGLYGSYLNALAKAAKNCNDIIEMRERHLCVQLGLSDVKGFRISSDEIDTSYSYLKSQKPGLELLKVSFALFLLALGIVCAYYR